MNVHSFNVLVDADIIVYKACSVKNEYDAIQDGKIVDTFTSAKEYKEWFEALHPKIKDKTSRETVPQEKTLEAAKQICDSLLCHIGHRLNASSMRLYLTSDDKSNFRYKIATYKPYKGNRADKEKPNWYSEIREYLVSKHNAVIVHGMEADDALAGAQQAWLDKCMYGASIAMLSDVTCIASIDKDLLTVPGYHYNFDRKVLQYVTKEKALQYFYMQMLTGDPTDNIPSFYHLTGVKLKKAIKDGLLEVKSEFGMYQYVEAAYYDATLSPNVYKEFLKELGNLLYMRRSIHDEWSRPSVPE